MAGPMFRIWWRLKFWYARRHARAFVAMYGDDKF